MTTAATSAPTSRSTYSDGVAQGFLRPLDATLFDGTLYQTRRRQRDGGTYYSHEAVDLRHTSQQLTKVATDPQFWQVAARHAFEKVKALQEMWPRYCGIAGCATQEHARQVADYLQGVGARRLLAVSDDSNAHENLRLFKRGGWDMLVTVGMAHVGYDYKPIAVAAVLNGVREYNWLDQFTMRAGRIVPERPRSEQTAWIFGLNDRAMRQYVNAKRQESSRAIKLREEEEEESSGAFSGGGYGPRLVYNGVELDGISGLGFDHGGYSADLEDEEPALITDKEVREQLRRRRQGLVGQYAAKQYGTVNGETIRKVNGLLIARYHKPVTQCTPDELSVQIEWLEAELGLDVVEETAPPTPDPEESGESLVQGGLF